MTEPKGEAPPMSEHCPGCIYPNNMLVRSQGCPGIAPAQAGEGGADVRVLLAAANDLDQLSNYEHPGWEPAGEPCDRAAWVDAWERFRAALDVLRACPAAPSATVGADVAGWLRERAVVQRERQDDARRRAEFTVSGQYASAAAVLENAADAWEREHPARPAAPPQHVCGLQGFQRGPQDAMYDKCPACEPPGIAEEAALLEQMADEMDREYGSQSRVTAGMVIASTVRKVAARLRALPREGDAIERERVAIAGTIREYAQGCQYDEFLMFRKLADEVEGGDFAPRPKEAPDEA